MLNKSLHLPKGKAGVTAILVAIMIVSLLGFAALAIDIGYRMVTKNQLQNAADAAALAGARQLGLFYEDMTKEEQEGYSVSFDSDGNGTLDRDDIIGIARETVKANVGEAFNVADSDVQIGTWYINKFTATSSRPTAVRVISGRDGSSNDPINTFFANIFGIGSMSVSATATAALTGESTAPEGVLMFPIAISACHQCGDIVSVSPTSSCAGWNTYTSWSANANDLNCLLGQDSPSCKSPENLLNCTTEQGLSHPDCYKPPEVTAGITDLVFINGEISPAFDNFKNLFDAMKILNDGIRDKDEDPETWTVAVPVYEDDCMPKCAAPNGWTRIVGFATMTISMVGSSSIGATIICNNLVVPGEGGSSGSYDTLGSIPGLVE